VFGPPGRHSVAALNKAPFGAHTYANSAGGDPAVMPELTYEYIRGFFDRFYHPGNAIFVSRGDVSLNDILERVEEIVGEGAERKPPTEIPDVPRLTAPVVAQAPIPSGDGMVVLGWVLDMVSGHSYDRLLLDVAGDVLFDGDASPVRRAIRESGLVRGVLDTNRAPYRNPLVAIAAADTDPSSGAELQSVVLDAIAAAVRDGLDPSAVDDAITRLELKRRDQANGVGVFLQTVFPPLLYGGDPYSALELDGDLARLADARAAGRPLEEFIERHLVDNPHRARIELHPDPELEQRTVDTEAKWVGDVEAKLSQAEREEIVATTKRLQEPFSTDYPKRGLTPDEALTVLDAPEPLRRERAVTLFDQPTDGITHLTLRIDANGVGDEDVPYLGLLSAALSRALGVAAPRVTGLDVRAHSRVDVSAQQSLHWLEVSGRTLVRDQDGLVSAVRALADVGVTAGIASVISERASALEAGVMMNAQVHLRRLAASALRRSGAIDDATKGLGQIAFLKSLANVDEGDVVARLLQLRDELLSAGRIALCVTGAGDDVVPLIGPLNDALASLPADEKARAKATPTPNGHSDRLELEVPHRARIAALPVAFTCEAHAIGGLDDPDTAAIAVLTQLMWSGTLNAEIRRGGAYGVDFEVLPERGLLWISSRRDPMPKNSYDTITSAIARFADGTWNGPGAREGMIAILRTSDPVDTPASAARRAWLGAFTGHTADRWNAWRRRVLEVTDDDLERVAAQLTQPARATLIGRTMLDADPTLGELFGEIRDV
jgi:hypothetical protein